MGSYERIVGVRSGRGKSETMSILYHQRIHDRINLFHIQSYV